MAAATDAQQYAEALRKSLMEDLFEGEDLAVADGEEGYTDPSQIAAEQLKGLELELEEFANHDVIRNILDQGRVLKEHARDIDENLRTVELESIQDYIQESDNLVALHDQVDA
eukprot:jgi/Chrzof1/13579/Cz08g03020.t1